MKQRNDERVGHKEKGNLPLLKRYKEWTIRIGCMGTKATQKVQIYCATFGSGCPEQRYK